MITGYLLAIIFEWKRDHVLNAGILVLHLHVSSASINFFEGFFQIPDVQSVCPQVGNVPYSGR